MVGNKHVKNAVGAQSGEDSLRASHLKGGACPPLTMKKKKKSLEEKREISQLIWCCLFYVQSASQSQSSFQAAILGMLMYTFESCRSEVANES